MLAVNDPMYLCRGVFTDHISILSTSGQKHRSAEEQYNYLLCLQCQFILGLVEGAGSDPVFPSPFSRKSRISNFCHRRYSEYIFLFQSCIVLPKTLANPASRIAVKSTKEIRFRRTVIAFCGHKLGYKRYTSHNQIKPKPVQNDL